MLQRGCAEESKCADGVHLCRRCSSVRKACVRRYAISIVLDGQRCVRLCRRCPSVQSFRLCRVSDCAEGFQLCKVCDRAGVSNCAEGVQLCRWGVTVQRVSNCADGV